MENWMEIARKVREEKCLNQEEAAKLFKVTTHTYLRWEKGYSLPRAHQRRKLKELLAEIDQKTKEEAENGQDQNADG